MKFWGSALRPVLVLLAGLLLAARPAAAETLVKIGWINSFTGFVAQAADEGQKAADLYLKLHVGRDSAPLTLNIPAGTEHSPYWVHQRNWKAKTVSAMNSSTDRAEAREISCSDERPPARTATRSRSPIRAGPSSSR